MAYGTTDARGGREEAFARNDNRIDLGNDPSSPPIINTIVHSPNGTDLTSSFRTMVYYQPQIVRPDPSLTGRDILSDRGLSLLGRPVNDCRSPTATFLWSYCKHKSSVTGSLLEYVVYCQEAPSPNPTAQDQAQSSTAWTANRGGPAGTSGRETGNNGGRPGISTPDINQPMTAEEGTCVDEEICVEGIFRERGWPQLASCISKESYSESEDEDDSIETGQVGFMGRQASLVVSALDERTPLEMRGLELDAGKGGREAGQRRRCTNCFELQSGKFEEGTDSLKMQASVVGTGAAAAAGVLWLAVLSG